MLSNRATLVLQRIPQRSPAIGSLEQSGRCGAERVALVIRRQSPRRPQRSTRLIVCFFKMLPGSNARAPESPGLCLGSKGLAACSFWSPDACGHSTDWTAFSSAVAICAVAIQSSPGSRQRWLIVIERQTFVFVVARCSANSIRFEENARLAPDC